VGVSVTLGLPVGVPLADGDCDGVAVAVPDPVRLGVWVWLPVAVPLGVGLRVALSVTVGLPEGGPITLPVAITACAREGNTVGGEEGRRPIPAGPCLPLLEKCSAWCGTIYGSPAAAMARSEWRLGRLSGPTR
jgi:hypothetical protein